jgi:hypothetical protein
VEILGMRVLISAFTRLARNRLAERQLWLLTMDDATKAGPLMCLALFASIGGALLMGGQHFPRIRACGKVMLDSEQ